MVRTRFAPSPTGFLHIGGFRTALYAYAMARHSDGQFILRIEDTDQNREVAGSTQALQDTLKKFGLVWDEYYLQSERLDFYKKAVKKLLEENHAYYCQCDSKELRNPCRDKNYTSGAVRLKVPENKVVTYYDFVHKKDISWNTNDIYDATLLKSDGFPTYHLAAMVDDLEMKITHILRGHDWLPSTPIHLLVFEYLGGQRPEIGHLSDILSASTGKKLSKRRDSVFMEKFIEDGFLPEALTNFVILLGWAPKDNREEYTLEDFVKNFNISGFQESNPRFEDKKLKWFNGLYLRKKTNEELLQLIKPILKYEATDELLLKIIPLIKERITIVSEFNTLCSFFFIRPEKISFEKAKSMLENCEWTKEGIEKAIAGQDRDFYMNLRLSVCGQRVTPPLTESMLILGKTEIMDRLDIKH